MSANGEIIKIIKASSVDEYFWGNDAKAYHISGRYTENEESDMDLIAEIPKELHQHLIKEVMNYWKDKSFRNAVNNVYGGEIWQKQ